MKILCVIDMQNDFITGSLGTKEAEAIVSNVIQKIRAFANANENSAVYFTFDTHDKDYLSTEEGKNLPVEHCIKKTVGWRLQEDIGNLAQEIHNDLVGYCHAELILKDTFGSVKLPTYIENIAKKYNETIESIELIGLCTDVCVISNALLLKAHFPNVPIYVDASCCAGVTPENHDTALKAMEACQIQVERRGKEPWR